GAAGGAEITAAGGGRGDAVGVAAVVMAARAAAVAARQQGILGDTALDRAGADGDAVVGAGDGYGDRLGRTLAVPVIDDDRVGLGRALAGRKILRGRIIDRVGPADAAAGGVRRFSHRGIDGERAMRAAAGEARRVRVAEVDVGERHQAADRRRRILVEAAALGAAGDADAVIGADDLDADRLGGGLAVAVADGHDIGLDHALADRQILRGGIVDRVGPADRADGGAGRFADRGGRERAEQRPGRRRHRPRVAVDQVDVGERDRAADRGGGIFAELAALRAAGDRDAVIGAGQGDHDILRGAAAVPVVDRDRIGLRDRLADGEILDRAVADIELPADRSRAVASRVVADTGVERAQVARRRWRDDEAVGVRRIDIGESKAAGRAVAAGIFGHAAGDRAAADRDAV